VLIRPDEVAEIAEPSNDLVMRPLVGAPETDGDLSVTWVRLAGSHRPLRTDRSTRLYYIVEGEGWFAVGETPELAIRSGDVVVVPRETPYALGGELTYLVVNGPAFVPGDDVYL
jgi:mannose-6-phosphate isomerase-like protein (cupin superfamily)